MAKGIRVRRYPRDRTLWEIVIPGERSKLRTTKTQALKLARDTRRTKSRRKRIRIS